MSTAGTLYVAEIQEAQATLNEHTVAPTTGRCVRCGLLDCAARESASQVFERYHWLALPRRKVTYRRVW